MNQIAKHTEDAEELPAGAWSKLMALAEMISIDKATGALHIVNGKSRLVLRKDGTILVEGERVIQTAKRSIALEAARIDLN